MGYISVSERRKDEDLVVSSGYIPVVQRGNSPRFAGPVPAGKSEEAFRVTGELTDERFIINPSLIDTSRLDPKTLDAIKGGGYVVSQKTIDALEIVLGREKKSFATFLAEESVKTGKDFIEGLGKSLSQTKFFREAAAGLDAPTQDITRATTEIFASEELPKALLEAGAMSGRTLNQMVNTFVVSPLNFTTRSIFGKTTGVGESLAEFSEELRGQFSTELSRQEASKEFSLNKVASPEYWLTVVAENILVSLAFLKVASVVHGGAAVGLTKLLGTSKFARLATTVGSAVAGGAAMRGFESAAEAEETYRAAKAKGWSEERAVQASKETFVDNMKLVGLDAVQVGLALAKIRVPGVKSVIPKIAIELGKLGIGGFTEGAEEVFQFAAQKRALDEPFSITDPESLESGFIGFVMGVAFQGGGRIQQFTEEKTQIRYMDAVVEKLPQALQKEYLAATTLDSKQKVLDSLSESNAVEIMQAMEAVEVEHQQSVEATKKTITKIRDYINENVSIGLSTRDVGLPSALNDLAKIAREKDTLEEFTKGTEGAIRLQPDGLVAQQIESYRKELIELSGGAPISTEETIVEIYKRANASALKERPTGEKVERDIAPLVKQPRIRKDVALRQKLEKEETVSKRGARAGEGVGKAIQKIRENERIAKAKRNTELQKLKQRIKDRFTFTKRGEVVGARMGREEIAAAQKALTDVIKDSNLDANDRAKFEGRIRALAQVKDVEAKLTKLIPEVQSRVEQLELAQSRRGVVARIEKLLKKTAVKKQAGKPVGKFTPEIQEVLDVLRGDLKLTVDEAKIKLVAQFEQYKNDIPPPEVALENTLLAMRAGLDLVSLEDIEQLANDIEALIDEGKALNELKSFNAYSEIQRRTDLLIDTLDMTEGRESFGVEKKKSLEIIQNKLKTIGKSWTFDWDGLMNISDWNTPVDQKKLEDTFDVEDQNTKYKGLQGDYSRRLIKAVQDSYGSRFAQKRFPERTKKSRFVANLVLMDVYNEEVNMGEFTDKDGVTKEFKMTRGELIKRFLELNDPTLTESFRKGNRWTQDMIDAVEENMNEEDFAFAEEVANMYQEQYDLINPVYKRLYGINLPKNEFYTNIRRRGFTVDAEAIFGEFLEETVYRNAVTSGGLISRVKSVLPIISQDVFAALDKHMAEMNYFVAWAEKVRELNAVFKNQQVRDGYIETFGKDAGNKLLSVIDENIQRFATNGRKNATASDAMVGWLRTSFTVGKLMLKPAITVKQWVSVVAYLEVVNPIQFMKGVGEFFSDPLEAIRVLNEESPFIRERGGNFERDVKFALGSDEFARFSRTKSFLNLLMVNVRSGDKGAIVSGTWAYRKALLDSGMDIKDVIKTYTKFGNSTQQSADQSKLSQLQTGGNFAKIMTMFQTSQNQYLRKEIRVIQSLFQEGGTSKENLKKVARVMAIYHLLLPMSFQMVASGFLQLVGDDEEEFMKDMTRSAILGSVNGWFIINDVIDTALRAALGMQTYDFNTALGTVAQDVVNLLKDTAKLMDGIDPGEVVNAIDELADIGSDFGLPAEQAFNISVGFGDLFEGNFVAGVAEILGWTPYVVEEAGLKEERGESDGGGIPALPGLLGLPELPGAPGSNKLPALPSLPKF